VRVVQQLVNRLKRLGIEASPEDPRLQRLLDEVKAREAQGYAYKAADASFELLARGILGGVPDFFDVESYQIGGERKIVAPGVTYSASRAVVKIRIGEKRLISAPEGNGPVNALALALRKDLGVYQKHIEDLELLDYRVRVFRGGTDAVMRVLIEFGDGQGDTWSTVGASGNIIDASFQALVDTINYRLFKLGVPAEQGSRSLSGGWPKPRPGNGGADLAALGTLAAPSLHMALISGWTAA
jgi:2-isopropylmalate synthase